MNDKWKSLIELVVNEEEDKAKDLFHEIAVDESRKIYENLIDEEDLADIDEASDEDVDEDDAADLLTYWNDETKYAHELGPELTAERCRRMLSKKYFRFKSGCAEWPAFVRHPIASPPATAAPPYSFRRL